MKQKAKSLPRKPFCDDFQTRKKTKNAKVKKEIAASKIIFVARSKKNFKKNFGKKNF